jgi:hypothetical protein
MAYRHFFVKCIDPDAGESDLEKFLGMHRVIKVSSKLIEAGLDSFWAYQVEYALGVSTFSGEKIPKVDYKELLNSVQFTQYLQLRELRKELSEQEAIPSYTIFTKRVSPQEKKRFALVFLPIDL